MEVVGGVDGADGAGDGALRIYRSAANGEWPGALTTTTSLNDDGTAKTTTTVDGVSREHQIIRPKVGVKYSIQFWARGNTTDTNCSLFFV